MIDHSTLTKRYYTISEVAAMLEVATSLLRFWESVFPSVRPVKSKRGERRYTPEMIIHIQEIYELVKVKGHTLEGAKIALKERKKHRKLKGEILYRLSEVRRRLEQINTSLK